jgi:coenzyme Q-binding protein COQ10
MRMLTYQRMHFAAADLHELVGDVERYPEFIGPITGMRVTDRRVESGCDVLTAQARIRYKFVSESFTTQVSSDTGNHVIDVQFVSGPFRKLENRWQFHRLSDGSTLVEMNIEAVFKNPVLQMLLEKNRYRAAVSLVDRFSAEAKRRYQTTGDPSQALAEEIDAIRQ